MKEDVTIDHAARTAVFYDGTSIDLTSVYGRDGVQCVAESATVRGATLLGLPVYSYASVSRHTFTSFTNEDGVPHIDHRVHTFRGPTHFFFRSRQRAEDDIPALWVEYIIRYATK